MSYSQVQVFFCASVCSQRSRSRTDLLRSCMLRIVCQRLWKPPHWDYWLLCSWKCWTSCDKKLSNTEATKQAARGRSLSKRHPLRHPRTSPISYHSTELLYPGPLCCSQNLLHRQVPNKSIHPTGVQADQEDPILWKYNHLEANEVFLTTCLKRWSVEWNQLFARQLQVQSWHFWMLTKQPAALRLANKKHY